MWCVTVIAITENKHRLPTQKFRNYQKRTCLLISLMSMLYLLNTAGQNSSLHLTKSSSKLQNIFNIKFRDSKDCAEWGWSITSVFLLNKDHFASFKTVIHFNHCRFFFSFLMQQDVEKVNVPSRYFTLGTVA